MVGDGVFPSRERSGPMRVLLAASRSRTSGPGDHVEAI